MENKIIPTPAYTRKDKLMKDLIEIFGREVNYN
jgi:hypothetical protein